MENNTKNRELIAKIAVESLSFEEQQHALAYELAHRYKREPGLFDAVVRDMIDLGELEGEDLQTDNLEQKNKDLREAIEHVLIASEDGGDMNDIDWDFLRKVIE
jgi:hypothetical protein